MRRIGSINSRLVMESPSRGETLGRIRFQPSVRPTLRVSLGALSSLGVGPRFDMAHELIAASGDRRHRLDEVRYRLSQAPIRRIR